VPRRVSTLASFVSVALTGGVAFAAPPELSSTPPDPAILNGFATETCGWPTTVSLGGCTGTLVHPEVVIYAAHCGAGPSSVRFGESSFGAARTVGTKYCRTHPGWNAGGQTNRDHAFCVLDEPVLDVPIVPIMMGCEAGALIPGSEVVLVGFGQTETGSSGTKREAWTIITSPLNAQGEILLGGDGRASCFGDSGGPAYIRLSSDLGADDTWRVFGITSRGPPTECCDTASAPSSAPCASQATTYGVMHTEMEWYETELAAEGIDLTPCYDSDGTWNPTPECGEFPMEPQTGHSTWSDGCGVGGPVGPSSSLCGDAFDSVPDPDPPTVSITSPLSGSRFETNGQPTVDVIFTADASDEGLGVDEVRLLIDGEEIAGAVDDAEPWGWLLQLPPGQFVFTALAVDHGGNQAESEAVAIGVDMDAPELPSGETGGDDGTDGGSSDTGGSAGDDTGTGDDGATDEAGADGAGETSGCACTSGGDGTPPPAGALALLALIGMHRRRRA
jgi:MYXO-CTERM domain-containing protein